MTMPLGPTARRDASETQAEVMRQVLNAAAEVKNQNNGQQSAIKPPQKLQTAKDALAEEEDAKARELSDLRLKKAKTDHELEIAKAEKEKRDLDRNGANNSNPEAKHWSILSTGEVIEDPEGDFTSFAQARIALDTRRRYIIIEGKPVEVFEVDEGTVSYKTFAQALQVAALDRRDQTVRRFSIINDEPVEDEDGPYETIAQAQRAIALKLQKKELEIQAKAAEAAKPNTEGNDQLRVLNDQIKALNAKIDDSRDQISELSNPITVMTKANAYKKIFEDAGIISKPVIGNDQDSELELKREQEKNRREEADADRKDRREASERTLNFLSDIPKVVTSGISKEVIRYIAGNNGTVGAPQMETFSCPVCGKPVTVGPGTMMIICPHCGKPIENDKAPSPPNPRSPVPSSPPSHSVSPLQDVSKPGFQPDILEN